MSTNTVFIVWTQIAPRAKSLAIELGGQANFLYESRLKRRWLTPFRYLIQGWKTWRLLERERPKVVLVQSPPIFAPLVVTLWCKLQGKTRLSGQMVSYAIDCHTATFYN